MKIFNTITFTGLRLALSLCAVQSCKEKEPVISLDPDRPDKPDTPAGPAAPAAPFSMFYALGENNTLFELDIKNPVYEINLDTALSTSTILTLPFPVKAFTLGRYIDYKP